jgi:Protein of unknown function (DUF1573)
MRTELVTETRFEPLASTSRRILGHRATKVCAAALVLIVSAAAGWACGGRGALMAAYHYVSGPALSVDSGTKSFGVVVEGDSASVCFRLTNRGSQTVRVVGCMTYCNCVVPADLPFTLRPNETRGFEVAVRTRSGDATWTPNINQPVTLYTTNPAQAEIHLTVKGEVRGPVRRSSGS